MNTKKRHFPLMRLRNRPADSERRNACRNRRCFRPDHTALRESSVAYRYDKFVNRKSGLLLHARRLFFWNDRDLQEYTGWNLLLSFSYQIVPM